MKYRKKAKGEGMKESIARQIVSWDRVVEGECSRHNNAGSEKEKERQIVSWERGEEGECGRQIKTVKYQKGETVKRQKKGKGERGRRRER